MTTTWSRREVSGAVAEHGWRLVLGSLCAWVPAGSLEDAAGIAVRATRVAGPDGDDLLSIDVRRDGVVLTVRTAPDTVERGVALVRRLAEGPAAGARDAERTVQLLEVAIDAIDIPAVRPFWKAVLGYVDRPGDSPVTGGLDDPLGQGPPVWFQQMDAPRPQRNRVHLDISVPHDAALDRVDAALAAGGTVVSDASAPAFWVLADAEGNEACISTWQGRD